MSTSPVTPAPTNGPLYTLFEKYMAFFKLHERFFIVVAILVAGYAVTGRVLKSWDAHDAKKVTVAATVVKADTTQNDALIAQIANLKRSFAAQLKSVKEKADVKTKALAVAPVATVAQTLGGSAVGNDVALPLPTARTDATQLIEAPVVQAEASDVEAINKQDETLISGLQAQLGDQTKACTAQVAELKVKSKRSFLHGLRDGFIAGVVVGVVGALKL